MRKGESDLGKGTQPTQHQEERGEVEGAGEEEGAAEQQQQ
jgi:hypothetical protein